MNTRKLLITLTSAAAAALAGVGTSQAAHIDQLGLNAVLVSSNGAGSFSVRFEEYMGSDGWMWSGSSWNSTYSISFGASLTGPVGSSLAPTSGSGTGSFDGLVNSSGTPYAGFGPGQIGTQYITNLNDAARYSYIQNFSISNFNPAESYSVSISMSDCCFVQGGLGNPNFSGNLTFDPTQVVSTPDGGSSAVLLGLSLLGGLGFRMKLRA